MVRVDYFLSRDSDSCQSYLRQCLAGLSELPLEKTFPRTDITRGKKNVFKLWVWKPPFTDKWVFI